MKKGFTLIETLIYIGLFTLLIGAGFSTAYSLIQSGESLNNKTITNSELDFVLRKIDWALSNLRTINTPSSGISNELSVLKYDGTTVKIKKNGPKIEISEDEGITWFPLTTDNVEVTSLGFSFISGTPGGIIATTTINGVRGTSTKYIRK